MSHGNDWHPMADEALAAFVRLVNFIDGERAVSRQAARAYVRKLPFYNETVLVRDADRYPPVYYLGRKDVFRRLDGSSAPILEANAVESIALGEDNVLDYLRFFCLFVHGDEGAFTLIRSVSELFDLRWMDRVVRDELAGTIRPPSLLGRDEDKGVFQCEAFVLYGDDLFKAEFVVAPHGAVEMVTDEQVAVFDKFAVPDYVTAAARAKGVPAAVAAIIHRGMLDDGDSPLHARYEHVMDTELDCYIRYREFEFWEAEPIRQEVLDAAAVAHPASWTHRLDFIEDALARFVELQHAIYDGVPQEHTERLKAEARQLYPGRLHDQIEYVEAGAENYRAGSSD